MRAGNAMLVIIEFGATWPRWLDPSSSGDIAAVAQHYEGEPESLVTQVASRLGRLVAMGWQIDDVVLVSNGRSDLEAQATRSVLARGLLSHLREVGGVRLVLTVDTALGRRACHTVTALGASLQGAITEGIVVCVRLGEREPIYARPPVAAAG